MSDRAKAQRRRNAAHKASGLCKCGREPAPSRRSCAPCLAADNASAKRRYAKKRDAILAKNKVYRATNADKLSAACAAKWQATKYDPDAREARRAKRYERTFGLTQAQVDAMHVAQNNLCAICAKPFTGGRGKPGVGHIDHCHTTGKVRALLCFRCNVSVGKLEALEKQNLLIRTCAYILEHRRD